MDAATIEALNQTILALERRWIPPDPKNPNYYGYIPLNVRWFIEGMEVAMRCHPGRGFLDVGCGIGTKMLIARHLGYEVSGIEVHAPYAEVARELCPGANIEVADAFDVNHFDADVVYVYRPCRGDELEGRLERHVVANMNPGALIFCDGRDEPPTSTGVLMGPPVWRI